MLKYDYNQFATPTKPNQSILINYLQHLKLMKIFSFVNKQSIKVCQKTVINFIYKIRLINRTLADLSQLESTL